MGSDGEQEVHGGGLATGPAGEDSVPILLMRGEHIYDHDGRLLLVVGEEDENRG